MLEPISRNTAAAIVMAAFEVSTLHGEDSLLLVMPSDHVIADVPAFLDAVRQGVSAAVLGYLVTFGIRPTAPETGFGYLQTGDAIPGVAGAFEVAKFVEKPPKEQALAMVETEEYNWNAGIFLFRASDLLAEADRAAPSIVKAARDAISGAYREERTIVPAEASLMHCPSESIDYAVMERAERVAVVPMSPGWSDVGSWDALADIDPVAVKGLVTLVDCDGIYARSDGLEVAAVGLKDMIVVASGNRVLILPKGRSQDVKALLAAMQR
jgi:mannose-1-phosphate guanylyltransferase/mannose-1-phosphate guanylyltransferase/mannose-6-phosphate isomerase